MFGYHYAPISAWGNVSPPTAFLPVILIGFGVGSWEETGETLDSVYQSLIACQPQNPWHISGAYLFSSQELLGTCEIPCVSW